MDMKPGLFTSDVLTLSLIDVAQLLSGKTLETSGIKVVMDEPVEIGVLKALIDSALLSSSPVGLRKKDTNAST